MNGTKFLLDTNVVLFLLAGDQTVADLLNDKQLYISFVSELELLGYSEITDKEHQKIKEFINECTVINITNQIKEKAVSIRKKYKLKLPDSIIAATSQFLKIPLIISDLDFKNVTDISTIIYEF